MMMTNDDDDGGGLVFDINNVPFDRIDKRKFIMLSLPLGVAESCVCYPFYTMKTHLVTTRHIYVNVVGAVKMARRLGRNGLYRGFWTSTLCEYPAGVTYFLAYTYGKTLFQRFNDEWRGRRPDAGRVSPWVPMAAGAAAVVASSAVDTPVNVVVQRLQVQNMASSSAYRGGVHAFVDIVRRDGVRGLYRGYWMSLWVAMPQNALWWLTYETLKAKYSLIWQRFQNRRVNNNNNSSSSIMGVADDDRPMQRQQHDHPTTTTVHMSTVPQMCAAVTAGVGVTVATNPVEVIRVRLQTQHHEHATQDGRVAVHGSARKVFRSILKEEGVHAFMKGVPPRILIACLFSGTSAYLYEWVLKACELPP